MKLIHTAVACISFIYSGIVTASNPYWWTTYDVLSLDEAEDDALATLGQVKYLVSKTELYFNDSYESGAAEVSNLMQQSWFLDISNNNRVIAHGELKYISSVIYDKIFAEDPPDILGNGTDRSINTKWMVDASPFYDSEFLLSGGNFNKPINSNESIYPWSLASEDDLNNSPVTIGQLKFVFSFELASSFDTTASTTVIPGGDTLKEYQLYKPTIVGDEDRPLVVNLTGDGGYSGASTRFSRRGQYESYVLSFRYANNFNFDFIIQTVEELIAIESIDPRRIYFTGYSRGGVALMDILNKRPDLCSVAWFIDPGISSLGLSDNPFRDRSWTATAATAEQIAFAKKLQANQVTVMLSPADRSGNSAIWTKAEMIEFYKLFYNNDVNVLYSVLPRNHGISVSRAVYDFRYWDHMFQTKKL